MEQKGFTLLMMSNLCVRVVIVVKVIDNETKKKN